MKSRKLVSSILALTLAFGSFVALPEITDGAVNTAIEVSASEYYKTVNGFVLNKDSDGDVYVSDYKGKGGKITIPEEVKYIGKEAFSCNTTITSVSFPAGTTKYGIGDQAFAWCSNLKTVTIAGDVGADNKDGIGYGAFQGCHSLNKVMFTKKNAYVAYIGQEAFFSCYALNSINLPSGTVEICESAFENCVKLSSLTIPEKTNIEGSYVFGYMYGANTSDDYYALLYNNEDKKASSVKANGKNKVFWEIYAETYDEAETIAKNIFGTGAGLTMYGDEEDGEFIPAAYSFCMPLKQREIVLNVTAGSPAEKWAKSNKIKYKSKATQSVSDLLDAPANIDATKTKNTITLVWDDVKGAAAYRVYKYNEKTGKYEKYSNVSSSTCKVKGLSPNTTYKFKVVALKKADKGYKEGEYVTISVTTKK